ncbi:zinc finger BED domain-containing protein RICESLEEPER 2-like [Humulus lupulus]|uniref:zinc finger BED domain-containing protein RICESLEEPER 2-like n=1 Tax=Humulus lupulus TaxID=3486 RepID=UPI002B4022FD|nr:zinc finger BED domain-containing protein RICESLEEPER 2-like [Humulus lupulus]
MISTIRKESNFFQVVDNKGETIGKEIENFLNDWSISKLFSITVDNASSNDVAIRFLKRHYREKGNGLILDGKFLHMRCYAHIVNLIVSEGLKEKHDSIVSIRHAVRYVRSSPARLKEFKKVVIEEGIECKGFLCLDVQMRWNSTYLMLNCAIKFRKAFESMESNANFMK